MGSPGETPARKLFRDTPIADAYATLLAKALAAVEGLSPEVLLTADLPLLRQELVTAYRFRQLRLDWDRRTAGAVDGSSSIRVVVPFSGAPGLFDLRPAREDGEHPVGWVSGDGLVLVIPADGDAALAEFDRQRRLVTDWASRVNDDAAILNARLARVIRARVTSDARRLREAAGLALELGARPQAPLRADDSRPSPAPEGERRLLADTRRPKGGRPAVSPELNLERYEEAVRATPKPRSQEAIAANFRRMDGRIGVSPRYLRRVLRSLEQLAE